MHPHWNPLHHQTNHHENPSNHHEIPEDHPKISQKTTVFSMSSPAKTASPAASANVFAAPPGGSRASRPHRNAGGRAWWVFFEKIENWWIFRRFKPWKWRVESDLSHENSWFHGISAMKIGGLVGGTSELSFPWDITLYGSKIFWGSVWECFKLFQLENPLQWGF